MRILLLALLFAFAPQLLAQNWVALLKNTPAERFDDEDLRLFMDNARKALAEGKINEKLSWENPKTRARGDITVLRVFESKKKNPCREVEVRNEARGRKAVNTFNLCQVEGMWRLVAPSQVKAQKKAEK